MLVEKIIDYSQQIGAAVESADFNLAQSLTQEADKMLRKHLPLQEQDYNREPEIVSALEQLSNVFSIALKQAEEGRAKANKQLSDLGKSRKNTNQYLDIARHLGA